MAKAFTGFKSESGKVFDTMYDATRDDFCAMLTAKSGNAAVATQIVGAYADRTELQALLEVVRTMLENHPQTPRAAPDIAIGTHQFGDIRDAMSADELEELYAAGQDTRRTTAVECGGPSAPPTATGQRAAFDLAEGVGR